MKLDSSLPQHNKTTYLLQSDMLFSWCRRTLLKGKKNAILLLNKWFCCLSLKNLLCTTNIRKMVTCIMPLFIKWLYFTDKTCSETGYSHQLRARFCVLVDLSPCWKICCPFLHKACRSSLFCNSPVQKSKSSNSYTALTFSSVFSTIYNKASLGKFS